MTLMDIKRVYPIWIVLFVLLLTGCATKYPELEMAKGSSPDNYYYIIGAQDMLRIHVWRNTDITSEVRVRPDGMMTTPLIKDMRASGKTPDQLARDIEESLSKYIKDPVVSVIVKEFVGPYTEQVRVVGEATKGGALNYREKMTVLDVMIAVGGLTEFASGNSASIVRTVNSKQQQFGVRLDDLLKDGDISANVDMRPGDVLIIPETWF